MVAKKARTAAGEESRHSGRDEVRQVIHKLRRVQAKLDKVNAKAREKIMEIEDKYKEIKDPVYARRKNIISNIPCLWLTSFLYHPVLGNMLNKYDQEILSYLDSLSVEDFPDPRKGYHITFSFEPNPYFKNRELTKTIEFYDDGTLRSIGTVILWKRGMRPSGKRNKKRSGNKRPLSKKSFCSWISRPPVDTHEDMFAEIIKYDLWLDPVDVFNKEEDDYDDDFEDDEDEVKDKDDGENNDGSEDIA